LNRKNEDKKQQFLIPTHILLERIRLQSRFSGSL